MTGRVMDRLHKSKMSKNVSRFQQAFDQYGGWAIVLSFFFPGIRMVMPYVTGASQYPFPRYLLYASVAGFAWLMIYFNLGRAFPEAYEEILPALQQYLVVLTIAVATIVAVVILVYRKYLSR
ncbi:DedA family protein [Planococcus lenghuensis]|uniref:DedA family protein n=1 Tax=Planococcus lenghuensis TaxID=2213202 RepID=UPI001E4DAE7E|nr:VTT domain-containing protein [Planococcus lenghuensis]